MISCLHYMRPKTEEIIIDEMLRYDREPKMMTNRLLPGTPITGIIPAANTTAEPSELVQWEIRVQAFQNCVNIAMCNRVGTEDRMEFSGESIVCDHTGNAVALAGATEELLLADTDIQGVSSVRECRPYLSLRRPELYR